MQILLFISQVFDLELSLQLYYITNLELSYAIFIYYLYLNEEKEGNTNSFSLVCILAYIPKVRGKKIKAWVLP